MLSLVSYGSSGESEDEDNSESGSTSSNTIKTTNSITKPEEKKVDKFENKEWDGKQVKTSDKIVNNGNPEPLKVAATIIPLESKENLSSKDNLLSNLPPPVSDLRSIPWDQLSKLTYKSRAIRIMAPSIPEDVEEKKEKKLPSKTGSGLLAMLPKPRNQFLATPSVLKPRTQTSPAPVKPKLLPKPKLMSIKKLEDHESDSDGESNDKIDFFSLTSAPEVPEISASDLNLSLTRDIPVPSQSSENFRMNEIPLPVDQGVNQPASSSGFQKDNSSFLMDSIGDTRQQAMSSYDYVPFQQPNDELQLDSEALEALCGTRGRKRKGVKDDEFKVIDINGSELTPDAQELLAKNLTSDQPRPKRNSKDGPTSQQKRKHQIIYLAHQAKEQELELQNTWSNNRMSKKQTQAKYGF